jgi:hypothetical protein
MTFTHATYRYNDMGETSLLVVTQHVLVILFFTSAVPIIVNVELEAVQFLRHIYTVANMQTLRKLSMQEVQMRQRQ